MFTTFQVVCNIPYDVQILLLYENLLNEIDVCYVVYMDGMQATSTMLFVILSFVECSLFEVTNLYAQNLLDIVFFADQIIIQVCSMVE